MTARTKAGIAIAQALLKEALRRDRDHGYRLLEDYVFYLKFATPAYMDDLWVFTPVVDGAMTRVTLRIYDWLQPPRPEATPPQRGIPVNDGASFAPDAPAIALATIHDPGYLRIPQIAAAWREADCLPYGGKWNEAKVRRMFDDIGGDAMRKLDKAPGWLVRTYYSATRWFGGIFLTIKKVKKVKNG